MCICFLLQSKKIKLLRSHSSQHAADGEIKILWENRETELFDSIEQRVVQPEEKVGPYPPKWEEMKLEDSLPAWKGENLEAIGRKVPKSR